MCFGVETLPRVTLRPESIVFHGRTLDRVVGVRPFLLVVLRNSEEKDIGAQLEDALCLLFIMVKGVKRALMR